MKSQSTINNEDIEELHQSPTLLKKPFFQLKCHKDKNLSKKDLINE